MNSVNIDQRQGTPPTVVRAPAKQGWNLWHVNCKKAMHMRKQRCACAEETFPYTTFYMANHGEGTMLQRA
jgi:hypothetical protein